MRKWIIRSLIFASLILEVWLLYPIAPSLRMTLVGATDCGFFQSLVAGKYFHDTYALARRIERKSSLVRIDGDLRLLSTPQGQLWVPSHRSFGTMGSLAEQESKLYGPGEDGVQKGDIVLDCGASEGTFTHTALNAGASLVVAIEPLPAAVTCLERNFSNKIAAGRVIIVSKGVWNKEERLTLNGSGLGASLVMDIAGAERTTIPVTTIDRIVDQMKLVRIDFIKMDIEGAERQAIEGASRTLKRWKPRLAIATEHFEGQCKEVTAAVKAIVPDYRVKYGPCICLTKRITPAVVYFR